MNQVVFVNLVQEELHGHTGLLVDLLVLGRDAEMERLVGLFVVGSFFVARAHTSQAQLQQIRVFFVSLLTALDDFLHVAALGANDLFGHLEVLLVFDLHIVSASEFVRVVLMAQVVRLDGYLFLRHAPFLRRVVLLPQLVLQRLVNLELDSQLLDFEVVEPGLNQEGEHWVCEGEVIDPGPFVLNAGGLAHWRQNVLDLVLDVGLLEEILLGVGLDDLQNHFIVFLEEIGVILNEILLELISVFPRNLHYFLGFRDVWVL